MLLFFFVICLYIFPFSGTRMVQYILPSTFFPVKWLTELSFLLLQVLKLELKEIREQQDLLFRFMNFLKQEGAVHVLQFCLAVGTITITHKHAPCLFHVHQYGST